MINFLCFYVNRGIYNSIFKTNTFLSFFSTNNLYSPSFFGLPMANSFLCALLSPPAPSFMQSNRFFKKSLYCCTIFPKTYLCFYHYYHLLEYSMHNHQLHNNVYNINSNFVAYSLVLSFTIKLYFHLCSWIHQYNNMKLTLFKLITSFSFPLVS